MKKKLSTWLVCLLASVALPSLAQTGGYSEEELPIIAKRLSQWSRTYPTVINNWNSMLAEVTSGEMPPVLSVITELNGQSTEKMDENAFHTLLMSNTTAALSYKKKTGGKVVDGSCTIEFHPHLYFQNGLNPEWPEEFPANVKITVDYATEFFRYTTFDYRPNAEADVDEASILKIAARSLEGNGLVRNESQPQLLLTTEVMKVEGNGMTCMVNVQDVNSKKVVWKLEYSGLNGTLERVANAIKSNIGIYCDNFPFAEPAYCHKLTTVGVAFESKETMYTGKVVYVLPGCDAYKKGLRGGDQVLKGYLGREFNGYWLDTRRTWFKAGKKQGQKNWGVDWFLGLIPIWPHYKKNEVEDFLTMYYPTSVWPKNHFKVKKGNGQKTKMDAPMDVQTYNFLYLR